MTVIRGYGHLLKSPRFLGYAIGGGCATTSLYAFVGAAPYIFVDQLGVPAHAVGFYLALNLLGMWLGSLTASRLIGKVPLARLMVFGNLLSCAAAAAFLGSVLTGALSVPVTVLSLLVLTYGGGIASPTALAQALSVDPLIAGSASGLYGFAQMVIGALCASLAGIGGDPALAAGITLLGAGLVAQLSFRMARDAGPR